MRKILVVLAIVSIVAGACGGSSKKSSSGGSSSGSTSATPVKLSGIVTNKGTKTLSGGSIEVEQDDFYFKPTFVKATPGTTVTVELHNEGRSEEHTSELQSQSNLVCRLLLEKEDYEFALGALLNLTRFFTPAHIVLKHSAHDEIVHF